MRIRPGSASGDAEGIDGTSNPDTVDILPGSFLEFNWSEADTGPAATEAGQIDVLDGDLGVDWVFGTAPLSAAADDVGSLAGRCDSVFSSTTGCVDELFYPTLVLSRSVYGASAAMIEWAQQNLQASWGNPDGGTPLQRLVNSTQQDTNNKVICDSTFHNFGSFFGGDFGDTDSCDEFPFASTYQSGAMNGVTSGSQCAQVSAVESGPTNATEAEAWNSVQAGTFSPTAKCVRGHIPSKLNSLVGTAYSVLISQYRLIDLDYFWVIVTS